MSDFFSIELGIKGNIMIIDPKSKLLITLLIVLGIGTSISYYQVMFYAFLIIPVIIFYRPNMNAVYRVLGLLPMAIILSILLYIFIRRPVNVDFLDFRETFSPYQFILFSVFKFMVSVTHSSILLESGESRTEIIDALAALNALHGVVTILHLANRMITRLQNDYNNMMVIAVSKGYNDLRLFGRLYVRARILSRILTKATIYSDTISYTLDARGYNQSGFTHYTRGWTSEGITLLIILGSLVLLCTSLPFWVLE